MAVETTAAVLRSFAAPQTIESIDVRDPGHGEVRVGIVAAGVCHSDVGQADGEWPHTLPVVLGHEGSGIVEAVGPGVRGVHVGQRVLLSLAPGCGACPHCADGRPILCQDSLEAMGDGALTTGPTPISQNGAPVATYALLGCFAGSAVVAARSAIPLPDGIPPDVAAIVGCAVITGFGAAAESIEIEAGSRGAVIGCGGVGQSAIQGARLRGAAEVIALDPSEARRGDAERLGATSSGDPTDEQFTGGLRDRAARAGLDWTIVTVGSPVAMRLGVDILRPRGTAVMVGLTPVDSPTGIDMLDLVTYERRIVGSAYGSRNPIVLMPRILELYRRGLLQLDGLLGERFPLEGINEAFVASRSASGGRPVLELAGDGRTWPT